MNEPAVLRAEALVFANLSATMFAVADALDNNDVEALKENRKKVLGLVVVMAQFLNKEGLLSEELKQAVGEEVADLPAAMERINDKESRRKIAFDFIENWLVSLPNTNEERHVRESETWILNMCDTEQKRNYLKQFLISYAGYFSEMSHLGEVRIVGELPKLEQT